VNQYKAIHLTDDQAIPGISILKYGPEDQPHWIGVVQDIAIAFYGNAEGPQIERIAIAQKIIPVLDEMEICARIDVGNYFTPPRDPAEQWTLLTVYFGFVGTEPFDEFSLHFAWGIWDWNFPYYARYRLNTEYPLQSTLVGFGRED
jgi:hypothetical protein